MQPQNNNKVRLVSKDCSSFSLFKSKAIINAEVQTFRQEWYSFHIFKRKMWMQSKIKCKLLISLEQMSKHNSSCLLGEVVMVQTHVRDTYQGHKSEMTGMRKSDRYWFLLRISQRCFVINGNLGNLRRRNPKHRKSKSLTGRCLLLVIFAFVLQEN